MTNIDPNKYLFDYLNNNTVNVNDLEKCKDNYIDNSFVKSLNIAIADNDKKYPIQSSNKIYYFNEPERSCAVRAIEKGGKYNVLECLSKDTFEKTIKSLNKNPIEIIKVDKSQIAGVSFEKKRNTRQSRSKTSTDSKSKPKSTKSRSKSRSSSKTRTDSNRKTPQSKPRVKFIENTPQFGGASKNVKTLNNKEVNEITKKLITKKLIS